MSANMMCVPVANDGTWFSPSLRRKRGYQVGEKGREIWVENYWEALTLACMHKRWRRPSDGSGRFGIVKCVGWLEVPKDRIIDLMLSAAIK